MKNKIGFYFLIMVMLMCSGLFVFLFINCIKLYHSFDLSYDDVIYEELTFLDYDSNGELKEVYVKEYETPFLIDSISFSSFDIKTLEKLESNEVIKVYYIETSTKDYQYELCEVKVNNTYLLTLQDYVKENRNNQRLGMVFCPVLIVSAIVLIVVFLKILYKNRIYLGDIVYAEDHYVEQVKEGYESLKLGKVKIEYQEYSDTIQVYNSFNLCSLVINGKVYDQFIGVMATKFTLQAKVENSFRQMMDVKVVMDGINLKLYINDKKVAKKFIALG